MRKGSEQVTLDALSAKMKNILHFKCLEFLLHKLSCHLDSSSWCFFLPFSFLKPPIPAISFSWKWSIKLNWSQKDRSHWKRWCDCNGGTHAFFLSPIPQSHRFIYFFPCCMDILPFSASTSPGFVWKKTLWHPQAPVHCRRAIIGSQKW